MADRDPARSTPSTHGTRLAPGRIPHFVLFTVVGAALVRLARLQSALCWHIVIVSGLLAVGYATGLVLWKRLGPRVRRSWVAALLLLWTVLMLLAPPPLTGAYAWCAVPVACVALRALGQRSATAVLVAITVVLIGRLTRTAGGFDPELVLIPVAAVWGTVALYRALQRDAVQRRRLLEELEGTRHILAEEQRRAGVLKERERIARDLHDTLAQELAGNLMLLHAAERDLTERPDAARARMRAAADGLDAGLAETRRIIRDLTPTTIAEAGLEGSLRLLCERAQQEGTAARVRFRAVGTQRPELDAQSATTLFRVAQSMLANVREHAQARNLLVTLHQYQDRVELELSDDGVGFVPSQASGSQFAGSRAGDSQAGGSRTGGDSLSDRGLGLPAARARLREYGGDLDVGSVPGRGTRVRARLPARSPVGPRLPVSSVMAR
ncbi:sensor histidine kinase [Streptomyces cellulosae]|uniref:sensor histidine kinase n=1 Tax=Streptomyces cellulosae TaxID=1968 RepID=UPI0004CC614E|nr:sensor histidine kinase [Streptomyces cellulosae]